MSFWDINFNCDYKAENALSPKMGPTQHPLFCQNFWRFKVLMQQSE